MGTRGYCPLRSYAAIGDGRTVALIALDGSVDWLCVPDLDSPAVFARLLDAGAGGSFAMHPDLPFTASRRYLQGTNVLETTFRTEAGVVRVTDAMTVPGDGLSPQRELVRSIEGLRGTVPMTWKVSPRPGYGTGRTRLGWRAGVPVATWGNDAMAVCSWGAGTPSIMAEGIAGALEVPAGGRALFALSAAHQEPLVLAGEEDVRARLVRTIAMWREWSAALLVRGDWYEATVRSALVLKLLVYAPSGAIAAAATTSLPEALGGGRNWDYRFCWVRDSALVLNALLRMGCLAEADAFFWWLMQASQLTHPRLRVLYRLDGGVQTRERTVPLQGYLGSAPVRIGNAAADQIQLDVYGDLLQAAWLYASAGRRIDADIAHRLSETADLVCTLWAQPDAGLWEVRSEPQHFTQSKMMCAIALDRAVKLAERGYLPTRHVSRWVAVTSAIREYIETQCWSDTRKAYLRYAGGDELDASVLLGVIFSYQPPDHPRLVSTVRAIREELMTGPFLYRYSGDDGLSGQEGAFLTCSFWMVEAMALQGQLGEATEMMHRLVSIGNDVGIFAEEVEPGSGDFLGNLPQGLTHLSLINAALTLAETSSLL